MQDSYTRWAMLEITDLQGRTVTSEPVPLASPFRQDVSFSGVRTVDAGSASLSIESLTLVTGNEPQIELRYSARRETDEEVSVSLTDFSLNGVPVGSTLFGSRIPLGDVSEDTLAAVIRPKHILSTGQAAIASIAFTAVFTGADDREILRSDIVLSLELDARILLPQDGPAD